jgi:hypothetical protein
MPSAFLTQPCWRDRRVLELGKWGKGIRTVSIRAESAFNEEKAWRGRFIKLGKECIGRACRAKDARVNAFVESFHPRFFETGNSSVVDEHVKLAIYFV